MLRNRFPALLLCLTLLTLGASSVAARDMSEYARYLGVRLRMYAESYEALDKIIADGTPPQQRQARQFKAEVIRSEADYLFGQDGDADKQLQRYLDAVKVFGEGPADNPRAAYDKARLQLDIAKVLQRSAPDEARKLCDDAITECDKNRKELGKLQAAGGAPWAEVYKLFCKLYFTFSYGHYIKALTYPTGDANREPLLVECIRKLDDFQFSTENDQGTVEEQILAFELQGDVEIARGKSEAAVGKFLQLAKFMEDFNPNAFVGKFALENGYLRAAALLTTELDYDAKFLTQCLNIYNEAHTRYGTVGGLEYQFKSFQLFRISAQIKLGDAEKFQSALDLLFKLAADRDVTFRRQAVSVLADIAVRDKLDNEMRFKCATAAYSDLDGMAVSVLLRLAQAHAALLASCSDEKTFETYAPACFERAGNIYFRMWRFLDAALLYREGATRTAYFMNKFDGAGQVPEHMANRTPLIKDPATLVKFPSEMATQYYNNAKLLLDAKYGEPGNREFMALLQHAENVKARLGGEQALLDKEFNDAFKVYQNEQFVPAAVRFAGLPSNYRKYYLAMVQAATCYFRALENKNIQRISSSANAQERESDDWFNGQKQRHGEGMAALPAAMWQGHESHWDTVLNAKTSGPLATWHKAVYFFKRYFLLEAARSWSDIEPLLANNGKSDYVDAILAVGQFKSAQWQRSSTAGRQPDADLGRIGRALYYYAYTLRNPPGEDAALIKAHGGEAVRVLVSFPKLFEAHIDDARVKKAMQQMSFYALADAGDVPAAEAAYASYKAANPQEDISDMIRRINILIQDTVLPEVMAMSTVATSMQSLANQMKKNSYVRIAPSYVDDVKKLAEAKTDLDRQNVLAQHFWTEYVMNQVFEGRLKADIARTMGDVQPALKAKWDELAAAYPKRWGDAVYAEVDALLKQKAYESIAGQVRNVAGATPRLELLAKLRAMSATKADDQLLADFVGSVSLATKELAYFVGGAFVYEFAAVLEKIAEEATDRCRPRLTLYLKYYEEYLEVTGRGGSGLTAPDVRRIGKQYFTVRDWPQAIRYLQEYVDKYGTTREYGPEEDILVDTRSKSVGRAKGGDELEVKYLLGKSYLERYKTSGDAEDLRKAALLMRRCWCFNLMRDANEVGKTGYTLTFKKELEDYYLYIGQDMAEIFRLMFAAPTEIKVAWPKYVNRYTLGLAIKTEDPVQAVPTDKTGALWHASQIQLGLWQGFMELDPREQYKFRTEFRQALVAWLELLAQWVDTNGAKDMGVADLKGSRLAEYFNDAVKRGVAEQDPGSAYMDDSTKAFAARLKAATDKLSAACKKAGIALKG